MASKAPPVVYSSYRPRKALIGTVSRSNRPRSIAHASAILYGKLFTMAYCKTISGAELEIYLEKMKIVYGEDNTESCLEL